MTETLRCPVCSAELIDVDTSQGGFCCPRRYCGVTIRLAEGEPHVETFKLANHYSICVLPFSFPDHETAEYVERLERSTRWQRQKFSVDNQDDVDRMEYFLPYIRNFLFPGANTDSTPDDLADATCHRWTFDLSELSGSRRGLRFRFDCVDSRKNASFSWNMFLDDAELLLFSYRVGFLILRFRCADDEATFFDQMSSLNYLRPIAPLYKGFEMPKITTNDQTCRMPQLLAYLLAELQHGRVPTSPASVPAKVQLPVRPIFDDRMMVYTFSCVRKDTCLEDPEQCERLLRRGTVIHFDEGDGPPDKAEDQEDPTKAWLRKRWQGFSKEGTCLVAFDTDRFHERFLGVYHGTYYFDIFLLAILQRVTLLTLYERLSSISALTGEAYSRRNLRRVRRDLLLFKNQCCFSQITNRERGLVLWRRWQQIFENSTLLQEVNDQSGELDNYLQNRMRERIERLFRLGGFLAASIPLVLGLDVVLPPEDYPWVETLRYVVLLTLLLGSGLFAFFLFFRQRE